MKVEKIVHLAWVIFASVGVILIMAGLWNVGTALGDENKGKTKAIITQIYVSRISHNHYTYNVFVSYRVNGQSYESKLNSYSSNFYEGKEIDIYYDKNNPYQVGIESHDFVFELMPLVLGGISFTLGSIGIIVEYKKKKGKKTLKENGELIYANYIETIMNTSYSVNRRHPYKVICEWYDPADNQRYVFKSKDIWTDPERILRERNVKTLPVYLNLSNKKQYLVDMEEFIENY